MGSSINEMSRLKQGLYIIGYSMILVLVVFMPLRAFAAGSVVMSAESTSSVEEGTNVVVSFYATPSSANIYSGEFRASLSRLSLVSYSPSGSPFNGLNIVVSGNSEGSTDFTVAFSHIGAVPGSSSKALVGKATLRASNSPGVAKVELNDLVADDNSGDPMATSMSNKTISIIESTSSTCPDGQSGTPPDCTNDNVESNSSDANNTNPIDTPNSNSEANISTDTDETTKTVTEDIVSEILDEPPESTTGNEDVAVDTDGQSAQTPVGTSPFYIIGSGVVLVALSIAGLFFIRKRRPKFAQTHESSNAQTVDPTVSETSSNPQPQIIRPTVEEGSSASSTEETDTPQL